MGKALRPGGLYKDAVGDGYHDGKGNPLSIEEAAPYLSEDELERLGAVDLLEGGEFEEDEPAETQIAGTIAPTAETTEDGKAQAEGQGGEAKSPAAASGAPADELGKDFPGYEALIAAGLSTRTAVFAHPNLIDVKGVGPATVKQIEALRPKAPEA